MMRLFAQSKVHRVLSSLALLGVIVLAVAQSGYVEQVKQIILEQPEVTTSYRLTAPEFEVADEKQLYAALQTYDRDNAALANVATASGLTLEQIEQQVDSVIVIDNGAISLQFSSNLAAKKLKSVYEYLAAELKQHLLEQLMATQAEQNQML